MFALKSRSTFMPRVHCRSPSPVIPYFRRNHIPTVPLANSTTHIIGVYSHFFNEDLELRSRKWLCECVSNHEFCGDIPDGNAPGMYELSSVMILNIDMLRAWVSVGILCKSKHALIVTVNDQRAPNFNTRVFQQTIKPDSLLCCLAHCHIF